jgi:hypothetical protein
VKSKKSEFILPFYFLPFGANRPFSKFELGHDRQVIRGAERRPAFVQKRVREPEIPVEINMIEMKDRQDAGKGPRRAEMRFSVDRMKPGFEKFGRQAARPFVKIARDDAFSGEFRVFEKMRGEQLVNLPAALEKRRPEMDVEKLQSFVRAAERDLGQKTAARLVFVDADVEILRMPDRQPAQNGVAVQAAPDLPVFAQIKIHAQFFGDKFGLMVAFVGVFMTENFLQCDHVGIDLPQNLRDPFRRKLAVDADAFMNIVGRDAKHSSISDFRFRILDLLTHQPAREFSK